MDAPEEIPCLIAGGVLPERSLVGLVAQSGAGKTFLALDMCAHMALCLPWRGRNAGARGVLYVAGEGFAGLPLRLRAWCTENEVDVERLDTRLAFLRVPLDISDNDMVQRVLDELQALEFEVECIVLDTLSSNAPMGFNESDTANMKLFLDAGRALRDRLSCTVLFIHHAGHNAERERGSSDFRAALDTMLFLRNDDGLRTLTMNKGRDFEPMEPIRFRLRSAHGSAVIDYDQEGEIGGSWILTPGMKAALHVLAEEGQGQPLRIRDWQVRTEGRVQKSQFYEVRKRLENGGYIAVDRTRGAILTARGEQAIERQISDHSRGPVGPVGPSPEFQSGPVRPPKGGAETGPEKWSDRTTTGVRPDQNWKGPGLDPLDWDALERAAS
jgi:hypothetical protein